MSERLRIGVIVKPGVYRRLFTAEADADLRRLGEIEFVDDDRDLSSGELAERIGRWDVCVTGWHSPRFTADVLEAASRRLKLVAHSAGSIKFMMGEECLRQPFLVSTAAAGMAPAVAEMTLQMIMLLLRPIHRINEQLHAGGDWKALKAAGFSREIAGQRVGVIGAGHVGRQLIRVLRAMNASVWCYDPTLTQQQVVDLQIERSVPLDELLVACPVVCMLAPIIPATRHMIGAREFALMRDGAMFVNTGRSWCVDQAAMLAELQSGRISAALDVFDEEPLPADHPLRELDNVILTPHLGAATVQGYFRQGDIVVDEISRFAAGQPLRYAVSEAMYATMA